MRANADTDDDNVLVVQNLQCWRGLTHKDIGRYNQNSDIVHQSRKKIGVYSVKGVSFKVKKGERFVILGSAGSGRSSIC